MDTQRVEPEDEELAESAHAPLGSEASIGPSDLEPGTWKDSWLGNETVSPEGIRFDRLTQFFARTHSRRRLRDIAAVIFGVIGLHAGADAKKRKKKKKKKRGNGNVVGTCTPACDDGYTCEKGVCACPNNVFCEGSCCAASDVCLEGDCCPNDQICDGVCCPDGNSCVRNECCSNSRVCGTTCCEGSEVCANIVPGGIKGCCENPLTIRGETCCPTGSITTRLNCGSYQCKYALSGTGPGGCDLWCKVGSGGEGAGCSRDIEGFPVPGDPEQQCCCGNPAHPGVCTYPVPG
jgi:hypothetical protein